MQVISTPTVVKADMGTRGGGEPRKAEGEQRACESELTPPSPAFALCLLPFAFF